MSGTVQDVDSEAKEAQAVSTVAVTSSTLQARLCLPLAITCTISRSGSQAERPSHPSPKNSTLQIARRAIESEVGLLVCCINVDHTDEQPKKTPAISRVYAWGHISLNTYCSSSRKKMPCRSSNHSRRHMSVAYYSVKNFRVVIYCAFLHVHRFSLSFRRSKRARGVVHFE